MASAGDCMMEYPPTSTIQKKSTNSSPLHELDGHDLLSIISSQNPIGHPPSNVDQQYRGWEKLLSYVRALRRNILPPNDVDSKDLLTQLANAVVSAEEPPKPVRRKRKPPHFKSHFFEERSETRKTLLQPDHEHGASQEKRPAKRLKSDRKPPSSPGRDTLKDEEPDTTLSEIGGGRFMPIESRESIGSVKQGDEEENIDILHHPVQEDHVSASKQQEEDPLQSRFQTVDPIVMSDPFTSPQPIRPMAMLRPARSPFFIPPKTLPTSRLPFPPLTASHFGLIQEELSDDSFWLLIATTFLTKTKGTFAIPIFRHLKRDFPTPQALLDTDDGELFERIKHLGLARKRITQIKKYASGFINSPPHAGKRYWIAGYPKTSASKLDETICPCGFEKEPESCNPNGDSDERFPKTSPHPPIEPSPPSEMGSDTSSEPIRTSTNNSSSPDTLQQKKQEQEQEQEQSQQQSQHQGQGQEQELLLPTTTSNPKHPRCRHGPGSGWEIGHLTSGHYALDSWRIFCRDKFLYSNTSDSSSNTPVPVPVPVLVQDQVSIPNDATSTINPHDHDHDDDCPNTSLSKTEQLTSALPATLLITPASPTTNDPNPSPTTAPLQQMAAEWQRVLPSDKELRACLRWMWMRVGYEWDPVTGKRVALREEMRRAVNEGRVVWDHKGDLNIVSRDY